MATYTLTEVTDGGAAPTRRTYSLQEVAGEEPLVVRAGRAINEIPRQLGLTARYALEGPAQAAQIVTEPVRAITDRLLPFKSQPLGQSVSQFADWIGLPKPRTATERVVGDATRLLAGSAATMGAAGLAAGGQGALGAVGRGLAANPAQQLAGATGAGLAGGASREAGGNEAMQFGASLAGGLAGAAVPGAMSSVAGKVRALTAKPQDMDLQIKTVLQRAGVDYGALPEQARTSLRTELNEAMRTGRNLDADAVRRLADFRLVGATPTRGAITQDPVQITREMNLAKIGANSSDEGLQGLARVQNANNQVLIRNLNDAGAARGDAFAAGQSVLDSIAKRDAEWGRRVSGLYDRARGTAGAEVPLQRAPLINSIYDDLARENKLAFLPENVKTMLDTISRGQVKAGGQTFEVPFNANTIDNLTTMISTAQRGAADGNVRAALGIVRKAIDNAELAPIKADFGGSQAATAAAAGALRAADASPRTFMDALGAARSEARARFGWQEASKPVQAALNGAEPDKFVQKFVIGGSLDDLRAVVDNGGGEQVKSAVLAHLKARALNGAADEVGKFSQAAYNKAISDLGPRKLSMLFSPEELQVLQAVGRVASYTQVQPIGSAVNNSNTGGLIGGRGYDMLRGIAGTLPFGRAGILDPLRSIDVSIAQRRALNVTPGLLAPEEAATAAAPLMRSLLAPGVAAGGLLSAPQ